jgi:glycosyltransferase involved in cell wall biosynthesis
VGDGEEREHIELKLAQDNIPFCDALKQISPEVVTLTSWIKDVDVVNAGADIVVLTSLNEGTPVSLIEAQAANKPVVTTNVGGISDIVIPGTTALLAESNDVSRFAEQLLLLIEDEKTRESMSQQGWSYVREKFHYTRLVNEMDELYTELLMQAKGHKSYQKVALW